jgi:hypothetical protein
MYDQNPYQFHQNPYQVLIDHQFYINFTSILHQFYINFTSIFYWFSIVQLSKINVTLCHTVLFRWYCEYPSPIVPSPKVKGRKRRHLEKRREKRNSGGRFQHFALRWLEITNFPHVQINAIFKIHLTRHIKNTCTNCAQISHVFRTRFSHFFIIFRRFCKNHATLRQQAI